jgi:hypothetical protein
MGGACSTNGGEEDCIWIIRKKAREKETTMINQDVGGRILLRWILER